MNEPDLPAAGAVLVTATGSVVGGAATATTPLDGAPDAGCSGKAGIASELCAESGACGAVGTAGDCDAEIVCESFARRSRASAAASRGASDGASGVASGAALQRDFFLGGSPAPPPSIAVRQRSPMATSACPASRLAPGVLTAGACTRVDTRVPLLVLQGRTVLLFDEE